MPSLVERVLTSRTPVVVAWLALTLSGAAAMIAAMVPAGPSWLGSAGAIAVATAYAWALAGRTGGRPVVFGCLALLLAVFVVLLDEDLLRTGAAVLTAAAAAVLAVMATVPARGFVGAARECLLATAVAAVGALAVVGFEPALRVGRFEYVAAAFALVGVFTLVFRLGAGWHGLGRRGLVVVVTGGVLLFAGLLYAELLRSYSTSGMVDTLLSWVRWSRDHLGAFPRPLAALLGVPALAYGCHMRARRRQGWWVCAFGVAATAPTATVLVNPAISLTEAVLSVVYGLLVGLAVGWGLIRLDLALTGSRGKRSRAAERSAALRPEPARIEPLL